MAHYSETTLRVFDCALEKLEGTFPPETVSAIRKLVEAGEFADIRKVEEALVPPGSGDGD